MTSLGRISSGLLLLALLGSLVLMTAAQPSAKGQAPAKETMPGVESYTRLDASVACGGTTSAQAFPELKRRGFKAVIDLRQPTEPNANIEAEGEAARAAGLRYINLPFNAGAPNAASLVESFLKLVTDPANLPVLVHSVRAHRAVGMLLIKRVLIDEWNVDKALAEADATALSDGSPGAGNARKFGLDYIKAHSK